MRKVYLSILLFFLPFFLSAQELSQRELPANEPTAGIQQYGDFLLDMTLMAIKPSLLSPTDFNLFELPVDYNQRIFTDQAASYGKSTLLLGPSSYGFGSPLYSTGIESIYSSSFKLNDKLRLNTYGQYDASGRRRIEPSALPWERNDFKGAFELKSSSGFGVRIEVQRKTPRYLY